MPIDSQKRWISPRPTRSTTVPVHVLSLTMIIITSASRNVIQKPGVRCWKVPESLSWYFASIVHFWSSASLPARTDASAAIMIEILRVLADGTGTSPARFAVSPLLQSLRYQLDWNGSASHRAFICLARSFTDMTPPRCVSISRHSTLARAPLLRGLQPTRLFDAVASERLLDVRLQCLRGPDISGRADEVALLVLHETATVERLSLFRVETKRSVVVCHGLGQSVELQIHQAAAVERPRVSRNEPQRCVAVRQRGVQVSDDGASPAP